MEFSASLSILVLLFSITQAFHLKEREHVDIMTQIVSANNGSMELLMEGDILVPKNRNALTCPSNNCFWKKSPNGLVEVPFIISNDYSSDEKSMFADAIATFHSKTCIRFVPRTVQTDYISIENSYGCFSAIGRTGGSQRVSLSRSDCMVKGVIQHELNHALGFYHEHTRSDRDNYITINWENINSAMQSNFNKENTNNLGTPYDYSSVMHYGRTTFSMNGRPTITPAPNPLVNIGQRKDLSPIDINRINILYNC